MSVEAMTWVFKNSPYSGDRLVIHLAIADAVNDIYDNEFWVKVKDLARKSRCSVRTVQYALRDMENQSLLVKLVDSGGKHEGNRYQFTMTGANDARVQTATETGANGDIAPIYTKENPSTSVLPTGDAVRLKRATYPPDFQTVWQFYPRRIAKLAGYKAWRTRVIEARKQGIDQQRRIDALLNAAKQYAIECTGRSEDLIMHPATFYGPQDRWRDYARKHGDDYDDSGARRITKEEMAERERKLSNG